jgi:hypothetical protein
VCEPNQPLNSVKTKNDDVQARRTAICQMALDGA